MQLALETLKEIDKLDLQHKQIKGVTRQYGNMGAIDFETKQSLTFIKKDERGRLYIRR